MKTLIEEIREACEAVDLSTAELEGDFEVGVPNKELGKMSDELAKLCVVSRKMAVELIEKKNQFNAEIELLPDEEKGEAVKKFQAQLSLLESCVSVAHEVFWTSLRREFSDKISIEAGKLFFSKDFVVYSEERCDCALCSFKRHFGIA